MFNIFKNKEIESLAKDIIETTKTIWNILNDLSKKKKKISKEDITKELAKFRIGIIDDEFFDYRFDIAYSHRWLTPSIEQDDRKNWGTFKFTFLGIMDFAGFSLNFDYQNMEIEAFYLDNQYMPAGPKGKKLHDAVVKIGKFKERSSLS